MTPRIIGAPMPEDQAIIIDLLKETLAEALEGKIKTIGIIACFDDGFGSVMAGKQAGALNLACDELKSKILAAVLDK